MNENFNWKSYINTYDDLKIIKNKNGAWNHWIKNGKKEGRILIQDTICLFHCGDIVVFEEMINLFPLIGNMKLIITYFEEGYDERLNEFDPKLNIVKLIKVENKGMDIGAFLVSISYLLKNKNLYNSETRFLKLHTKSISKNRNWTLDVIGNILKYNLREFSVPCIFGCDKYVFDNKNCNTVYLNYNYMKEIFTRQENKNLTEFNKYFDIYNEEYISSNGFTDLYPSRNFYRYYHSDLKSNIGDVLVHWRKHGINEHFRRSNINYIKSWAIFFYKFIAGTMFGFNKKWLSIFNKYNLENEFSILERGYTNNKYPTRVHSWEYYFGLITVLKNGKIIGCDNNIIKNIYSRELFEFRPKYSLINNNFLKSKIAIFVQSFDISQKGYNYIGIIDLINLLNKQNFSVDIYTGKFNDTFNNYNKNVFNYYLNFEDKFGMTKYNQFYETECDIDTVAKHFSDQIDINLNNIYLGFRCQRKYNIIIASSWHVGELVYNNKQHANEIFYLIQNNKENIIKGDIEVKKYMTNSFNKKFKYYPIYNQNSLNKILEDISQLVNSQNLKNST